VHAQHHIFWHKHKNFLLDSFFLTFFLTLHALKETKMNGKGNGVQKEDGEKNVADAGFCYKCGKKLD